MLLLIGATSPSAFARDAAEAVHFHGYGAFRIGMTPAQLARSLDRPFNQFAPPNETLAGCYYPQVFFMEDSPVSVMIQAQRVARLDIGDASPAIRTTSGIGIGSDEQAIQQAYAGRVTVSPHHSEAGWHYLTVLSSDGQHGFRFETDGRQVIQFYVGTAQAIGLVEGCG